jgi:adenine-specific DNA methylase
MIPKDCKRLAEVDFPIAVVSKHSAREKSIRHGHPSTLHLWWARRPLAACRAILLGLLLPDPCDVLCPDEFKGKARNLLPRVQIKAGSTDKDLRKGLLDFIGDFANWDAAAKPNYIEVSRALVKAAHPEETPLMVDPFAGGGSIPLEALRLGCETFASDLNPVACLILKVMLEDIPRHGPELAEELRRVGKKIKEKAENELAEFYPKDPDGATPIAYLWARTVRCESPNCGAEIPLARSFWLCKKANRRRALKHRVVWPAGEPPRVEFEIFEPKNEKEVRDGTVTRAKATCVACGAVLPPERVRAQLAAQRGGADVIFDAKGRRMGGARMLTVVTLHQGVQGRHYRLPTKRDYQAVWKAQERLKAILEEWESGGKQGLCPVPDELMSTARMKGNSGFRVLLYGMLQWGDLFTARQKVALVTLARLARERPAADGDAVRAAIAICVDKVALQDSSGCRWKPSGESLVDTFGRQALPIVWDFAESTPFAGSTGDFKVQSEWLAEMVSQPLARPGQVQLADATEHPLPDETAHVWFTDPPYYDQIAYADLSDFFFVWLKRALPGHPLLRDPFDPANPLTPKAREIVVDSTTTKGHGTRTPEFYERSMARAFAEGRRVLREDGVGAVVFAHKTTEGWEALLSGMIRGGWTITGSWPIATEMGSRLNARETASLATSVHLICRPRPEDAPVGDWVEVLRDLPKRVGDWMERLQGEGIRGADLVFACIGPALEIFSRYRKVETADSREVKLAEYLEKIWEVVGRSALEQVLGTAEAKARNGGAGALEEDARLTALFLWTLQATDAEAVANGKSEVEDEDANSDEEEGAPKKKPKGFTLIYDVVRRFAQPLGIHLPDWEGRIIETEKGIVRLLSLRERAKQLFGEEGAEAVALDFEQDPRLALQQSLFPEADAERVPRIRGRRKGRMAASSETEPELKKDREPTTLDRVHAAMLLQAGGQANGLRALIKAEMDRGPDFLRLANALSALYGLLDPKGSEEKRLLDGMLQAAPK